MARNIGVNFNGKHLIHPGAWSRINATALNDTGPDSRRIVFLGTSEGGTPNQLMWFSNLSDAQDVLRSGDLLTAGQLAWNPSPDGEGAGTIGFIRVQTGATQASLTQGNMVITAKDYGAWTNQIQVKLENGTTAGSKKITVYQWKDNVTEVFDNLGTIFTIQYTGTQAYASLSITQTNGKATTLTVKVGADSGSATPVMTYNLGPGQWNDIYSLVNDINQHAGFTATIVPTGNKNITTDLLDAVNNQDIKTSPFTVTAMQGDIINQVNNLSKYVNISFTTGTFPTNFPFTYLSGATDGTVPSSWASFYDLVRTSGAYLVVPLTTDASLQAECNNFVNTQEAERNYMMGIYGSDTNDSVEQAINRAVSLNSSRAVVTYPSVKIVAQDGTLQTLPGYMTAALIAGRIAGKDTGDPITMNYVNVAGLSQVLKSADIDRLLSAGVTPLEYVRYADRVGYRIAQGVTTWQIDGNPSFREISMRIIADTLASELTEILETKFVGGKGTASAVSLIKNEVQSYLDRKVREDVLVEYDPSSVVVSLQGQTVYVNFAVMPVGALNYILITTTYYQKPITA